MSYENNPCAFGLGTSPEVWKRYVRAAPQKGEIARMTPEQRAEEYCREYGRHGYSDSEYLDLLGHYIDRNGLKALRACQNRRRL